MAKRFIMLHHSLTKDSGTVSWSAIHRYHVEVQRWRDIGYHAGIEQVREPGAFGAYAVQGLVGRAEDDLASACPQGEMNELALHLCFIGNFDQGAPPLAVLERGIHRFILPWMRRHGIPAERIVGHRDYNPAKSCPGRLFDIDLVRRMVR